MKLFSYLFKLDKEFVKSALVIAIPLMVQQLIVSSVNLIDNLMVGQLGDVALSSVSNANRFYMIVLFGIQGMIAACTIYLSQYNGADDVKHMKETFRFSIVSSYIMCAFFFMIAFLFPSQIISFFIHNDEVIATGTAYLRIACFTYIPVVLSLCISASLRALGETRIPLYVSIVSVLTNTFLNYCLIFGNFGFKAYGVKGAALATLCARILEMIIYLVVIKRSDMPFKTRIRDIFDFSGDLAKHITIRAIPLCINETMWSFGMSTLLKCYANRGLEVNTAYGMASTISDLFFVLFSGMATATTVLVGTLLGANRLKEAKENGYKLISLSIYLSIIFLTLMFMSSFVVPYLYNVSIESKHLASSFLKIMAVFFMLYMFNTECFFILRSGGDTKSTLIFDSCFMWVINIPLVVALSYLTDMNILMMYAIGQSTDILKAIVAISFIKKEKWVRNLTNEVA